MVSSRDKIYVRLSKIALSEFCDIVERTKIVEGRLRLLLKDESFIDIWLSEKRKGIYAYHWERKHIDDSIYRENNIPDKNAKKLKTFPKHFHKKSEGKIIESNISDNPEEGLTYFLEFARDLFAKR